MQRVQLGAVALALMVGACDADPSPSASSPASDAASFSVTGSGGFCGPWWYGCGAVLVVEAPGWSIPDDWSPSADDTHFAVDPRPSGSDGPATVTGVRQLGQDRIAPGEYRFVVIETRSPDNEPEGTLSASVACSVEVSISPGTRAVGIDVAWTGGPSCRIIVSME